jgi:hypothetical protein
MQSLLPMLSVLIGLAPAAAQEAGDPRLGLDVARESCASCHAILRVEDRSPNPNAPTFAQCQRSGHERDGAARSASVASQDHAERDV